MFNLYQEFKKLLPDTPLLVGDLSTVSGDAGTVTLLDGRYVVIRGATGFSQGAKVFVKDGLIVGPAPSLSTINIEV